jgi:hypothetical protein
MAARRLTPEQRTELKDRLKWAKMEAKKWERGLKQEPIVHARSMRYYSQRLTRAAKEVTRLQERLS